MSGLASGPESNAFARVAEEIGGDFEDGYAWVRIRKRAGDWLLTLDYARPTSATSRGRVRLRAPFYNPERRSLKIRQEGTLDGVWKTLGFVTEVDTGDDVFDSRHLVKGTPRRMVRDILEETRARGILEAHPGLGLEVLRRTPQDGFPLHVDLLHGMDRTRSTPIPERMVALVELALEVLPHLVPLSRDYEDDVDKLLQRLMAPGGRAPRLGATGPTMSGPDVLWDGDPPRRDAARRLGAFPEERVVEALLSVTGEDDDALVAHALRSLGEIGDPRAVPRLIEMLGERTRDAEGASLGGHAATALEALELGAAVRAFESALGGDPEPLRSVAPEHRDGLVRALMRVVDSAEFGPRAEAARALGAIGAREALPLLRSKSGAWGMRTTLTEAAREAIEAIEARASLPRPAEAGPGGPDTLPRPADASEAGRDRLPRPADGEADAADESGPSRPGDADGE